MFCPQKRFMQNNGMYDLKKNSIIDRSHIDRKYVGGFLLILEDPTYAMVVSITWFSIADVDVDLIASSPHQFNHICSYFYDLHLIDF